MKKDIRKVGFIGLGKMGNPIAMNILKAGYDLTVYNRTPEKMKPLLSLGAKGASSPLEAARGADVVITCLMDDQTELDCTSGEDGLLAGLKPGGIHIGTATISPTPLCSRTFKMGLPAVPLGSASSLKPILAVSPGQPKL